MTVQVIRDGAALEGLEPEWRLLWEDCPAATPFQSPEWLIPWWRHLARGRLETLALREQGRLAGLVPLFVTAPLGRVSLLGTGGTDYLDALARPGCEERVARAAAERFRSAFCDFQQLPPGAVLLSGCEHPTVQEVCPFLPLAGTPAAWQASLPPRLRGNLRYYRRRLEREGARFEIATRETLPELLDCLFELHRSRWRRRGLPGVLGSKRVQAFHREAAARFLRRGWLRLHALRLSGVVRAVLYCFLCRGRVYYYAGGFHPELERMSPGTVLTGHAMAEAIREGAREFDFLRGDEPYKYAWGARDRPNYRRVSAPDPLRPAWARVEEGVERAVKAMVRRSFTRRGAPLRRG